MLEIVKYPNPVLRRGGRTVTAFDAELARTAERMFEAMYQYDGVGLAAPQVALDLKLLVLNPAGSVQEHDQAMVLLNPRIVTRKKLEWGEEGCLSFPGIYAEIERHRDVVVEYHDLTGATRQLSASGFLARIVQHELDHLEGVLFIDRMSPAERIRVRARLLELEQAHTA
jgi:peptide deformylase